MKNLPPFLFGSRMGTVAFHSRRFAFRGAGGEPPPRSKHLLFSFYKNKAKSTGLQHIILKKYAAACGKAEIDICSAIIENEETGSSMERGGKYGLDRTG
ncbi:hypothetical protein A4244_11830 [Bacillus badius]|nr:hypothetical protein A4244_11830 [Bacillus badius]OCS89775.1 hypothetical protein A6M11_11845 [Bacillus badius]OVE51116.1 hypothetical protein B1A98_13695 [Bacillus badius]